MSEVVKKNQADAMEKIEWYAITGPVTSLVRDRNQAEESWSVIVWTSFQKLSSLDGA